MSNILLDAIEAGNSHEVARILNEEPGLLNIHSTPSDAIRALEVPGMPLHMAVGLLRPELVHLLLSRGANPNQEDNVYFEVPLEVLFSPRILGDINQDSAETIMFIMQLLFQHGALLTDLAFDSCRTQAQATLGHLSYTTDRSIRIAPDQALAEWADIERASNALPGIRYQDTINRRILKVLYKHYVYQAFINAVRNNTVETVNDFLSKPSILRHDWLPDTVLCRVSVDFQQDPSGGHYGLAVLEAAKQGHVQTLALLKENLFSFNVLDLQGNNILHYAVSGGNLDTVSWLFSEEKEVCLALLAQENRQGRTARDLALQESRGPIVDFFDAGTASGPVAPLLFGQGDEVGSEEQMRVFLPNRAMKRTLPHAGPATEPSLKRACP